MMFLNFFRKKQKNKAKYLPPERAIMCGGRYDGAELMLNGSELKIAKLNEDGTFGYERYVKTDEIIDGKKVYRVMQ